MNIWTFNFRGYEDSFKRRRLSQIITKGKVDMCFIQESKVQQMEDGLVSSMWGSKECELSAKASKGIFRGILTI